MPLPFLAQRPKIWPLGLGVGKPLVFDATIREQHGASWTPTTTPIEGGSRVTDHVQPQPIPLVMDVALTDTPAQLVLPQRNRAKTLYGQLLAVGATRQPMDVETSTRIYTSMVITSIGLPRSDESGQALVCTVTWQEIEIATVDQAAVLADAAVAMSLGSQNLGNLEPTTDTGLADAASQGATVV